MFALFRIMYYPGPIKISTITAPRSTTCAVDPQLYKFISRFLGLFIQESNFGLTKLKPPVPFTITKASPNSFSGSKEISSHPNSAMRSMIALYRNPVQYKALKAFVALHPSSAKWTELWERYDETLKFKFTEFVQQRIGSRDSMGRYIPFP